MEFVDDIVDKDETEKINKNFMHWSPEEIEFYYELMLQQIDDQKLDGKSKQQRMVCGSSSHTNNFSKKKLKHQQADYGYEAETWNFQQKRDLH